MTSIRIPLQDFQGVDLRNIKELALVFDQTPSAPYLSTMLNS